MESIKKLLVNYHIMTDQITISYSGKLRTLARSSDLGIQVLGIIKASIDDYEQLQLIPEILDASIQLAKASPDKEFEIIDGSVHCFGEPLPTVLSNKIIKFMGEQLPFQIFLEFWKNLKNNPSQRAREELYGFLEANHFPLTLDGCFLAYKLVATDYKDLYSGTFDNSPGVVVEMDRREVDGDKNQTCSKGLHVASHHYARNVYGSGGGPTILLEVKVNPADVVAVPTDYHNAKMRVCSYLVIGPIVSEHKQTVVPKKALPTSQANTEQLEASADWAHLGTLQVGKISYNAEKVTEEQFNAGIVGHKKICKYDQAAAFKTRDSELVYRLALGADFSYWEKAEGHYFRLVPMNP